MGTVSAVPIRRDMSLCVRTDYFVPVRCVSDGYAGRGMERTECFYEGNTIGRRIRDKAVSFDEGNFKADYASI